MRKSVVLVLLPAFALGGCMLFGGGAGSSGEPGVRRTAPLVIPSNFTLPPPGQAAASAPAR